MVQDLFQVACKWLKSCAPTLHHFMQILKHFPRIRNTDHAKHAIVMLHATYEIVNLKAGKVMKRIYLKAGDSPKMDVSDRLIIGIVDRNHASRLVQLILWQLCLFLAAEEFTFIQVASVIVVLSHSHTSRYIFHIFPCCYTSQFSKMYMERRSLE